MKKVVALLVLALLITTWCTAQKKTQVGAATYNEDDRSLKASHANLAFGTRIRVTNQNNDKAVIVTVMGRIPDDPERIIDVGTLAADNIEIDPDELTPVVIEVLGRKKLVHPLEKDAKAENLP
jgi:rare lipoprotein A